MHMLRALRAQSEAGDMRHQAAQIASYAYAVFVLRGFVGSREQVRGGSSDARQLRRGRAGQLLAHAHLYWIC